MCHHERSRPDSGSSPLASMTAYWALCLASWSIDIVNSHRLMSPSTMRWQASIYQHPVRPGRHRSATPCSESDLKAMAASPSLPADDSVDTFPIVSIHSFILIGRHILPSSYPHTSHRPVVHFSISRFFFNALLRPELHYSRQEEP